MAEARMSSEVRHHRSWLPACALVCALMLSIACGDRAPRASEASADAALMASGDHFLLASSYRMNFVVEVPSAGALLSGTGAYLPDQAIYVPKPSTSKFFTVWNPTISNNFAVNSSSVGRNLWAENRIGCWLDTTKGL